MEERQTIPVGDGEAVVAVHHTAASTDWVIHCHGFLSDKSGSYERLCQRAVDEGYNAVRFDFRGCGEADGAFIEQTLSSRIADLRVVVEYFDPETYVLYGSSFGCKTAFHTAIADDRVEAVVGRAPVTYNRCFDTARDVVVKDGVFRYGSDKAIDQRFFDDFDEYPFTDAAATIGVPVALFHGRADETVPVGDTLDAAAELDTNVLVQTLSGEGHIFSEAALERMQTQMYDWLSYVTYST